MHKTLKDFSEEERKLILKDAEELGIRVAADKNDTTWQTIRSMQRMAEGRAAPKPTSAAERERIWQRVREVGFAQAAAENNLAERTLREWQKRFGLPKIEFPITLVKETAKRRSFTLEQKAEIVAQAKKLGTSKAAKIYNVKIGNIYKWIKKFSRQQQVQDTITSEVQEAAQVQTSQEAQEFKKVIQDAVQPQKLIHEETDEAVKSVKPVKTDEADIKPSEAKDVTAMGIEGNTVESILPVDSQVRTLVARIQELSIEVAILKEKNAGLKQKIEILSNAIKSLLE